MAEHHRAQSEFGMVQWVDCERCMVVDPHTGKPQDLGHGLNVIGTFDEAMACIRAYPSKRYVIVRFDAIAPFCPEQEIKQERYDKYIAKYGRPSNITSASIQSLKVWPADRASADGTIQVDGRPIGKKQFEELAAAIIFGGEQEE